LGSAQVLGLLIVSASVVVFWDPFALFLVPFPCNQQSSGWFHCGPVPMELFLLLSPLSLVAPSTTEESLDGWMCFVFVFLVAICGLHQHHFPPLPGWL
jgi:hypothetical protein